MRCHRELVLMLSLQILLPTWSENQPDESNKKTDRFGMGWWDPDPWISDPQPPAPLGPPPQRPQPMPPAPLDAARPPAPIARPPAPIQNHLEVDHKGGVQAEDIQCVKNNGVSLLSALVTPPPEYTAPPVLEDAPGGTAPPTECAMRPNSQRNSFAMHLQHFSKCGVRVQQGSDGKEWISVTLRFPLVSGLRMAEDEYVMILCKPQDRVATSHHVMDMRGTAVEGRSVQPKKVFRSGPKDLSCRMSLMTRTHGSRLFNQEMKSGSTVRVGQDLQIRAQIKEGDGWNFVMLKDIVITRMSGSKTKRSHFDDNENSIYRDQRQSDSAYSHDYAQLVFQDGCRNPAFRAVAPSHPVRDAGNPLLAHFVFKAFMFQDMMDGESLRLSAQVVACADIQDCQQSYCNGDSTRNGRRRRRDLSANNATRNYTEDFKMTVTFDGFVQTPVAMKMSDVTIEPSKEAIDCKVVLIAVGSVALLLCFSTTTATAIAIGSRRKKDMKPLKKCKACSHS